MFVVVLAQHAGMWTTVIRHASILLHDLKNADSAQVRWHVLILGCVHYCSESVVEWKGKLCSRQDRQASPLPKNNEQLV